MIEGDSCQPTIVRGDLLLVLRIAIPSSLRRADFVLVTYPPLGQIIKRIVALPGERITIAGNVIRIDGSVLGEPYATWGSFREGKAIDCALRLDDYFVLGDNRSMSTDSRHFGPVPRHRIRGRAVLRIWPRARICILRRAKRAAR